MMDELTASLPGVKPVPLVGIIKEVAPSGKIMTDEKLGVGEFQNKYFGGNTLYLDEELQFYKALGGRRISLPSWSPCALWKVYKEVSGRMAQKQISGNLAGEGLTLGGVLVIGSGDQGILYEYLEESGADPVSWMPRLRAAIELVAS
mmetsp:Transcript_63930/g.169201  ORF Transcript_63930/g.169201 Transcript_63930/m.169201 type:complete len:147 (-) Transcript_63930:405-845(-)